MRRKNRLYWGSKQMGKLEFDGGLHMNFLFVAFGGALGAMGRYAISLIPTKTEFPVLTLLTNLLGALLIGAITGIVAKNDRISANAIFPATVLKKAQ